MAKHIWSVLCSQAITDHETNSVSLINALEQVEIVGDPNEIERGGFGTLSLGSKIVSLWYRGPDDEPEVMHGRIRIRLPDGKYKLLLNFDVDLAQYSRVRFHAQINAIPILGPGVHEFIVQRQVTTASGQRWVTDATIPLDVNFRQEEPLKVES